MTVAEVVVVMAEHSFTSVTNFPVDQNKPTELGERENMNHTPTNTNADFEKERAVEDAFRLL